MPNRPHGTERALLSRRALDRLPQCDAGRRTGAQAEDLLQATERELDKIVHATTRAQRRLTGRDQIALRVGKVRNRFKMGKHFGLEITDERFSYARHTQRIAAEAALDGVYVLCTSVAAETLTPGDTVRAYKSLAVVERAFRSLKTVYLHVRPLGHRLAERVRAHVFLCMLAYYVEWHMRQGLAPLLFDDDDKAAGEAQRASVVDRLSGRRGPSGKHGRSEQMLACPCIVSRPCGRWAIPRRTKHRGTGEGPWS